MKLSKMVLSRFESVDKVSEQVWLNNHREGYGMMDQSRQMAMSYGYRIIDHGKTPVEKNRRNPLVLPMIF